MIRVRYFRLLADCQATLYTHPGRTTRRLTLQTRGQQNTGAQDSAGQLRRVRRRLAWSLALLFVIAMVLAGPAAGALDVATGLSALAILRVVAVAVTLPILMNVLARRVTRPTEELAASHDRLQRLYDQARLDALIDPITGLGNHRAFQEEITRQIEDARRQGHSLALALVDIDDLKRINDEEGHAGGDEVLAAMGRLIGAASRATDRGFRIGGDEFAVLFPRADAETATAVVHRLLASALNAEAPRPGAKPFSFSAGLSAYPSPAGDGQRLFRQADAALYWAKKHGRTDVQSFDPERHGAADDRRSTPELADAVMEVAARRAVQPVYQTIFDLRTGEPVGFEGLVRPAEGAGFRDAQSLFVAAEAAERTVELDLVCVEAVAAGATLPDSDTYLALNLSPRTLETEQFRVSDLLAILAPYGIPPSRVVLEITEREAIEDMARLRENLERCRAEGIRFAADDVGAGNAGLRLLSEIRFDIVKIDLSLVQRGALRDSALAVLRAIRDIGRQSGAMVVAEGIETADQLEVVRALELVAGQGYLLALPEAEVRAEALDLESLLQTHETRLKSLGGFLDLGFGDAWLASMGEASNPVPRADAENAAPGAHQGDDDVRQGSRRTASAAPSQATRAAASTASSTAPRPRPPRRKKANAA
jgi:diguanylate cyclase (GGDEF)-like protein